MTFLKRRDDAPLVALDDRERDLLLALLSKVVIAGDHAVTALQRRATRADVTRDDGRIRA